MIFLRTEKVSQVGKLSIDYFHDLRMMKKADQKKKNDENNMSNIYTLTFLN